MQKMKYSGVEWIGEIPEDWDIKRLKAVLCERNESNNPIKTDYILSLTNDRGVIPYDEKGDVGNKSKEDLSGYKLAYLNDIVLNSMNVIIGSVALSKYYGCVSPVYYMLYPRNPMDDVRYYNYIFQTKEFQSKLKGYGNGIMEIRMRIQMSKLNTVELPIPDATTQTRIADFLDDKCGKIDRYIEKQQQIIDKLKEYKQAVITEAVTKGLNPDVPMKDSGIEWIGMIREHWGVAKLANLFTFLGGYAFYSDLYVSETENLIVRIGNVKNDRLLFDANPVYISDDLAEQVIKFKLQCGDILFTMTGTKGKRDYFYTLILDNFHIQTKNLYLNQRVGCFRKKAHIHAEYYNYLLKDNRILDSIFLYETGTANQGNLGIDSINRTKVHLPPYDEQIMIANYLKEKCSRIDAVIAKKEVAINKSTEYKKSLIYEAVTGKLEV